MEPKDRLGGQSKCCLVCSCGYLTLYIFLYVPITVLFLRAGRGIRIALLMYWGISV